MTTPTRDHKVARSYEAYGTEFDAAGANGRLDPLDLIAGGPFTATDTQIAIEEVMERVLPAGDPWDETSDGSITAKLLDDWSTKRFYIARHTESSGTNGGTCFSKRWQLRVLNTDSYFIEPEHELEVNAVSPSLIPSKAIIAVPGPATYKVTAWSGLRNSRNQMMLSFGTREPVSAGSRTVNKGYINPVEAPDANTSRILTVVTISLSGLIMTSKDIEVGDMCVVIDESSNNSQKGNHIVTAVTGTAGNRTGFSYSAAASGDPGTIKFYIIPADNVRRFGSSEDPAGSVVSHSTITTIIKATAPITYLSMWHYTNGNSTDNADFGVNIPWDDYRGEFAQDASDIEGTYNVYAEVMLERIG